MNKINNEIDVSSRALFKYIDIREFVEEGFLQEANRLFFHPLGLALVAKFDTDGNAKINWLINKNKIYLWLTKIESKL